MKFSEHLKTAFLNGQLDYSNSSTHNWLDSLSDQELAALTLQLQAICESAAECDCDDIVQLLVHLAMLERKQHQLSDKADR
ncbi:MAG: hypothetical protein AB1489_27830 [Acidobacteriota bacterium]